MLPKRYAEGLTRVAVSGDDKVVVVANRENGTVLVWDMATSDEPLGTALYPAGDRSIRALSKSGTMMAFEHKGELLLAKFDSTPPVKLGDEAEVFGIAAFSPDERMLISADASEDEGTLRFWDTQTGVQAGSAIPGHHRGTTVISFSPDGRHFVTGGSDRELAFWEVSTRRRVDLKGVVHREGIAALAFSQDGRFFASAGGDRSVQVWDAGELLPISAGIRSERR